MFTIKINQSEKSRLLSFYEDMENKGHWGSSAIEIPEEKGLFDVIINSEDKLKLSIRQLELLCDWIFNATGEGVLLLPVDISVVKKIQKVINDYYNKHSIELKRLEIIIAQLKKLLPEDKKIKKSEESGLHVNAKNEAGSLHAAEQINPNINFIKRKKRIMTEINITPFTDVVLVLLIIFVVAAPIIYKDDINVNLPKSAIGKKSQNLPNNLAVTINKGDDVFFGDSRFNLNTDTEKIQSKITSIISANKDSVITVNGDKDCRYDSVVKLIGILDKAGLKKIVLGVELVR